MDSSMVPNQDALDLKRLAVATVWHRIAFVPYYVFSVFPFYVFPYFPYFRIFRISVFSVFPYFRFPYFPWSGHAGCCWQMCE